MSSTSRAIARVAVVATMTVTLAGCGTEEASILETAFEKDIRSANVALRIEMGGGKGAKPALAVSMRGPMKSNGAGKLESFDWRVRGEGAAQPLSGRIISSGRNVFVEYDGETYETGETQVAQLERGGNSAKESEIEDLQDAKRLGLDLESWFPESDAEQDSEVGGVATRRATGRLDLSAALKDLRRLAANPVLAADPSVKPLAGITPREIDRIDQLISDPRFEVDVADNDGKLRRVAATMAFRDGKGAPPQALRFVMEFRDVDQPVRIKAPAGGRPIGELLEAIGATGQPSVDQISR